MPAYLVVEHVITDAAKFEEYRTKVGPLISNYGGRDLTKGGTHRMPEGGHWKPERVVVMNFQIWTHSTLGITRPSTSRSSPFESNQRANRT
jgi:uncharacterized protein (DUF1330 family)